TITSDSHFHNLCSLTRNREVKRTMSLLRDGNQRPRGSELSDVTLSESFSLAWSEVWEAGLEYSLPTQWWCGPQAAAAEKHYATAGPLCTAEGFPQQQDSETEQRNQRVLEEVRLW
ncbi:hypothetical protein GOODEAATRI_024652, partial [Goodea atripinnis]